MATKKTVAAPGATGTLVEITVDATYVTLAGAIAPVKRGDRPRVSDAEAGHLVRIGKARIVEE